MTPEERAAEVFRQMRVKGVVQSDVDVVVEAIQEAERDAMEEAAAMLEYLVQGRVVSLGGLAAANRIRSLRPRVERGSAR